MSARLQRSSRVDGMMRSAPWSGQERALGDSEVETLPLGHPVVRLDGPCPDSPRRAARAGAVKDGRRPPRQRRVASLTTPSTLLVWREVGRSACHDEPHSAAVLSHALARELDAIGVMDNAIEDGIGESRIANDLIPAIDW
jgi:hypothetical protein